MTSNSRPTIDEYWCSMLRLVASRGTCARRKVGCIITDDHGHVLSTGYNGVAPGRPHCTPENPCPGFHEQPGMTNLCEATHAEVNAIVWMRGSFEHARTLYCTNMPCFQCAKMVVVTPIKRVVVLEDYADQKGRLLLEENNVKVELLSIPWTPAIDACLGMADRYDADIEGCDAEELLKYGEGISCSLRLAYIIKYGSFPPNNDSWQFEFVERMKAIRK